MTIEADVFSPNALGAILTAQSIPLLAAPIIAGGANNQLATASRRRASMPRGILYAPDYVINAGGIINVASEYFRLGDRIEVDRRIAQIPGRLKTIWAESAASGRAGGRGCRRDGAQADRAGLTPAFPIHSGTL